MIKKTALLLVTTLLLGVSLFAMTRPALAQIDPKGQACEALGGASGSTSGCAPADGTKIDSTLQLAINAFSFVVGIAAVIMIIVGGLKYVTSNGDTNNVNSAKNTILYAIIGLVVVVLAQVIVKFVLNKSASVSCTPPAVLQSDGTCS